MDLMELAEFIAEKPPAIKPKKYKVIAYIQRCLREAVDGIDTDDIVKLRDCVWNNCKYGYTCEVIYNETDKRKIFRPDKVTDIDELLKNLTEEE